MSPYHQDLEAKLCAITGNGLSKNERELIIASPDTAVRSILKRRLQFCEEKIRDMLDDQKRFIKAILDENHG